ncbi:MAG: hypothetical protein H6686_06130 [Fibrobacteria bacterium]|nr:hypothetical protein [Fibrobacteria bacterium]
MTMTPPVRKADLARFFDELRMTHLQEAKGFFGVLFDLSAMGPLHPDLRDHMISALKLLVQRGMVRSAFCLNNALLASQIRRLGSMTDTSSGIRFLDVEHPDWHKDAEGWACSGIEPVNSFDSQGSSAPT